MGGPVYHYDAGQTSATKFPAVLRRHAVLLRVEPQLSSRSCRLDGDGNVLTINPFCPARHFMSPMDMKFGPDGALYLLEWGAGFGGDNTDAGLYRIDYVAGGRSPIGQGRAARRPPARRR